MASSAMDSYYYKDMFGTEAMRAAFSDEARLAAWLQTEVALAQAQAAAGIIPAVAAEDIAAIPLDSIDPDAMKAEFDRVGFAILPFVHQLNNACPPDSARWLHFGATTQDILDTGMVLQMRKGLHLVEADMQRIRSALTALVEKHRGTLMAGRTFKQIAAPITFGYKVAVWLDEWLRHLDRLQEMRPRVLVGQCSGAVGSFASLGRKGKSVQREMMKRLGLTAPRISWHTARDSWAECVAFLAGMSATLAKIATEVSTLMRSEIGEVGEPFEDGRGASSTLPQKRNPISSEPIIACAHKIRECAGSQWIAMIQEHERGIGHIEIERMVVPEAFILASGALHHATVILEHISVDAERMRTNLGSSGGLVMAEAVMMGLAPKVGKKTAHDWVYKAAGKAYEEGRPLKEALMADARIMQNLSESEIDNLLDPGNYLGITSLMIDTVLQESRNGAGNRG